MVGTFADVVIADAIVKGVSGFDVMLAKDALLKDVRPYIHTSYIPYIHTYIHTVCLSSILNVHITYAGFKNS